MATNNNQTDRFSSCFENWMTQQEEDLKELLRAVTEEPKDGEKLRYVIDNSLKHNQDYCDRRATLAEDDAPFMFSPTWCSSLESSYFWLGGCRPSCCIRLVYALCGYQTESQLEEFMQGVRKGNLAELSTTQLSLIDDLRRKTVQEEDKLSSMKASKEEDVADQPLGVMAYKATETGESNEDVDRSIDASALALTSILKEADNLRLNTFKEIINILTPLQAVDLLVAGRKLHLSLHSWGKRRDSQHGRA